MASSRPCCATAVVLLISSFAAGSASAQERASGTPDGREIIVEATRSGRSGEREPIRVDILEREEVEEKLMMTPGNIAMLVSETPGLRTQITSPSLGSANVRVQGLKGRYTQLLADGLPLYGGQVPGIGLLQIPPNDLGQVEIIRGAASALYGPSALGGVINLVSRRPGAAPEADLTLNATSLGGQDANAYASAPLGQDWSGSLTGGFNRQVRQDLNGDGWADLPGYRRWTLRPRLFWSGSGGARLLVTAGAMTERRDGGTLPGRLAPDGFPFGQTLASDRFDAGAAADVPVAGGMLRLRASAMAQDDDRRFGSMTRIIAGAAISGKRRSPDDPALRRGWWARLSRRICSAPPGWVV